MPKKESIISRTAKRFTFGSRGFGLTGSARVQRSSSKTRAQGTKAWRHSHGFIQNNEKNPLLRPGRKYITFSEMLADHPVISSGILAFISVVQKTKWTVEPIEGDAQSEQYAEDIDKIFKNMETKLPQIMRRSAMYRYYGFGLQEWIAKPLDGGLIGIKDIEPRAQHTIYRWDISDRGDVIGVEQQDLYSGGEFYIDRRRLIYCVDDALNDSPEGLGIFRLLFMTAKRLDAYLMLEDIGFDTDLRGVPIVKAPLERIGRMVDSGQLSEGQAKEILNTFQSFIKDHQRSKSQGLMVDSETYKDQEGKPSNVSLYEVELLKGDGSAQADLQKAIERCRNDISMLLSTGFMLLGEGGAGSLALSKTKMDAFMIAIESTLEYMASVYERDLFKQIARLNGWDEESLPDLKFEAPKMQDIIEITGALRDMATAGAVLQKDDPIWDEVRGMMGLQVRPADLEFDEPSLDDFPGALGAQGDPFGGGPKPKKDDKNPNGDGKGKPKPGDRKSEKEKDVK